MKIIRHFYLLLAGLIMLVQVSDAQSSRAVDFLRRLQTAHDLFFRRGVALASTQDFRKLRKGGPPDINTVDGPAGLSDGANIALFILVPVGSLLLSYVCCRIIRYNMYRCSSEYRQQQAVRARKARQVLESYREAEETLQAPGVTSHDLKEKVEKIARLLRRYGDDMTAESREGCLREYQKFCLVYALLLDSEERHDYEARDAHGQDSAVLSTEEREFLEIGARNDDVNGGDEEGSQHKKSREESKDLRSRRQPKAVDVELEA